MTTATAADDATDAAAGKRPAIQTDHEFTVWQDGYLAGRNAVEGVPYAGFACWNGQLNVGYHQHAMQDGLDERIPGAGEDSIDAPASLGYEFCLRCGIREFADGTIEYPNGVVVQI